MRAELFLNNKTWISGPSFLLQSEEDWPVNPEELQQLPSGDPEVKVSAAIEVSPIGDQNDAVTCLVNLHLIMDTSNKSDGLDSKI